MKMFAMIAAALLIGGVAHANVVDFSCTGVTADTGDTITVSAQYQVNAGQYSMFSSRLEINGTDGAGSHTFSDGSGGGGTYRFFEHQQVDLSSVHGWFILTAHSDNGSRVQIRHPEGDQGHDYMVITLNASGSHPYYHHEFSHADCTFPPL